MPSTEPLDLLVHKILLNSVLLSPIVSSGVRPKPPGQTPLGDPLVFCRSLVDWGQDSGPCLVRRIWSGVRLSVSFQQKYPPGSVLYDVLRQQKTGL